MSTDLCTLFGRIPWHAIVIGIALCTSIYVYISMSELHKLMDSRIDRLRSELLEKNVEDNGGVSASTVKSTVGGGDSSSCGRHGGDLYDIYDMEEEDQADQADEEDGTADDEEEDRR